MGRDEPGSRCRATGDSQQAVDWGKQNVLDLTRSSEDLQIRWLDQGRQYSAPLGTVKRARWVGAGYPDYPWMFATDGEYTAFASVAMGQFEAIKDHLIGLRDVSEILNDGSGIVTHEVIPDGSNWFGQDSRNATTGARNFYLIIYRLLLKPFGQAQRGGRGVVDAQRHGLQALGEHPGVERGSAARCGA